MEIEQARSKAASFSLLHVLTAQLNENPHPPPTTPSTNSLPNVLLQHTGPSCTALAPTAPLMPATLGRSGSSNLHAASLAIPTAGVVLQDAGSDATVELPTSNTQLAALHAMEACLSPLPLPHQRHHASPQTPALHPAGSAQQAQHAQQGSAQQRQRQQELLGHIRQLTPQQFKAKMDTLTVQQQEAVKGIIVRRKLARGHGGQQVGGRRAVRGGCETRAREEKCRQAVGVGRRCGISWEGDSCSHVNSCARRCAAQHPAKVHARDWIGASASLSWLRLVLERRTSLYYVHFGTK